MNVSYTTPDGATSTAQLPETDPNETAGEVGINPNAPGTEPDGIEFPEPVVRTTGTLETAGTSEGEIGLSPSGPVLNFYRRFTETPGGEPVKGSCEPAAFDAVVEEWPTPMGTAVLFCDGSWATAGQNGTDFIGHFHFTNGQWEVIDYDGQSSVTRHHCFDHNKLRALGVPNDLLTRVLECD
ncbi:hypothetical protein [Corynebacterium tuscaniense]|uniref:hypothetical protein n=1 Tax=Corynebacterium tuscaniense TaxID=302449 RepID=UPI0012393DEC|nr:hypothetical protein [Corynebacterium tuscaniense]KAA8735739.1 hypothetical protein F4V54_07840 [Corynebacterium tuscaniense]